MSYTEQIREFCATELPKQKNKRELLLAGILTNAVILDSTITAVFGSPYPAYAAKDICKLLRNLNATVAAKPFGKRTEYTFFCENEKLALMLAGILSDIDRKAALPEDLVYYLRGLFLACGRITDPDAEAHFEFSLNSADMAGRLCAMLTDAGLPDPGMTMRRDKFAVYYKSRDKICDMLTTMDAGAFIFDYINRAIYKSIEWNEHRAINMISGNISRSVIAGEKQAAACGFLLEKANGLHLTPELYSTALLRLNNPNLSLAELAAAHNPPLTKSGLNNRLKKIMEIAEKNGFEYQ